jgi:toxin ParE1/3/4
MEVVFTLRAEEQLASLYDYIALRAGELTADVYTGRIIAACKGFSQFPLRGTRRNDILPGLRTIGFERRVTIAFMVLPDKVLIEGIFYGGQDFEAGLRVQAPD